MLLSVESYGMSYWEAIYAPDQLDMPCFQLSMRVVVHAGNIDGRRALLLGVVSISRKVCVAAHCTRAVLFSQAIFAAVAVARSLRSHAVVFAVSHATGLRRIDQEVLCEHKHAT